MATATYTIMHRDIPTVQFTYDLERHDVVKVNEVLNSEHAPLSIFGRMQKPTVFRVMRWWRGRGMAAGNEHMTGLAQDPDTHSLLTLKERMYCLSLSDCYWVRDEDNPLNWDDINFFDNDFSTDLDLVPLVHEKPHGTTLLSHTVIHDMECDVEQRKKWIIVDGRRMFMKAGLFPFNQAAYNEVIATRLHYRVLKPNEYIPYTLHVDDQGAYCLSECMLGKDEELIPMIDILDNTRKPPGVSMSAYVIARTRSLCSGMTIGTARRQLNTLVRRLNELGIGDAELDLTKMFVCDFILANDDRHVGNFGVIRDSKTLEFKRMAPIYDTGLGLWCRSKKFESEADFGYKAKPFRPNGLDPEKQLALFSRFGWLDLDALEGFSTEAKAILDKNPHMPSGRSDLVKIGLDRNIAILTEYVHKKRGK